MTKAQLEEVFGTANKKTGKLDPFFTPESLENVKAGLAYWRKQYPDIQWQVDSVVKKGDRVAFRYTATGTHAASRQKMSWGGTAVGKMIKGKVHLLHINEDTLGAHVGQGNLPSTPQDDISGTWDGDLWGVDFKLNLQQATGKDVVHGTISALGNTIPVSGTNDPPNVNISGSSPKGSIALNGTWASDNEIDGTLNGAGFNKQPITIKRQK